VSELPPCAGEAYGELAGRMQGHKQTTDAYLIVLARHHELRLATFDRKIARLSPYDGLVTVLEG
jgi:predicted nucleic acid-binding protein